MGREISGHREAGWHGVCCVIAACVVQVFAWHCIICLPVVCH